MSTITRKKHRQSEAENASPELADELQQEAQAEAIHVPDTESEAEASVSTAPPPAASADADALYPLTPWRVSLGTHGPTTPDPLRKESPWCDPIMASDKHDAWEKYKRLHDILASQHQPEINQL